MSPRRKRSSSPKQLRQLIDAAMEIELRTMKLYCRFESLFRHRDDLRQFWFDMAQHEARHFGALALVGGLLDGTPKRAVPVASLTAGRIDHLRALLSRFEAEAKPTLTLARAFEMALEMESSEIEDVVLDLLDLLTGEAERERAVKLLIHDLSDLSYMIEKYTTSHSLLARADELVETRVGHLRRKPRAKSPR